MIRAGADKMGRRGGVPSAAGRAGGVKKLASRPDALMTGVELIVKREIATNGRGRCSSTVAALRPRARGAMARSWKFMARHESHGRVPGRISVSLLDDYGDHRRVDGGERATRTGRGAKSAEQLRELTDASAIAPAARSASLSDRRDLRRQKIDPAEEESLRGGGACWPTPRQLAEAKQRAFALGR